jgi:NhaP-type Na+/H+ or K+/H+ antiporter
MAPKSLFLIIVKILGLLFFKEAIAYLIQLLTAIQYLSATDPSEAGRNLMYYTIFLIVYLFCGRTLLFRSKWILEKLKLDQGFDEHSLGITASPSDILHAAIIFVGGLMLCEEIPSFGRNLYIYKVQSELRYGNADFALVISSGLKILIGLLLIGERTRILAFLEKRKGGNELADQNTPTDAGI